MPSTRVIKKNRYEITNSFIAFGVKSSTLSKKCDWSSSLLPTFLWKGERLESCYLTGRTTGAVTWDCFSTNSFHSRKFHLYWPIGLAYLGSTLTKRRYNFFKAVVVWSRFLALLTYYIPLFICNSSLQKPTPSLPLSAKLDQLDQ